MLSQLQGMLYIGLMIVLLAINLFQIGKFKKGEKFPFLSLISAGIYALVLFWFFSCTIKGAWENFYFVTTVLFIIASIAEFAEFFAKKKAILSIMPALLSCVPWVFALFILVEYI